MDPRFARLDALFQSVRRLPPAERTAALERECGDDAELRAEVLALLAELDAAPAAEPALSVAGLVAEAWPEEPLPEGFAGFRILRRLAAGGMGVVYEAEQAQPRRRVALKVLHPGAASEEGRRRFEREAEFLARLHHPGIAQVHLYGTAPTAAGPCPFLAMELVDGLPLNVYARGLELRERLALLAAVCDAVAHAHVKGVIHRDLKPGNILVTPAGQPKVLDFGVARLLDAGAAGRTRTGQVIGTLAYMSPEQATGDSDRIDARTDVYALGVLGYEMLCGRLPHAIDAAAVPDAIRRIVEDEPPDPGTLDRQLRGDVGLILRKALAKEPARRYDGAGAMAEDIRRHLRDEPILARPPTASYQFGKFVRRHRALVAGTAATLVALLLGLALALRAAREEERQRIRADAQADESRRETSRARLEAAASDLQAFAGQAARRRLERIPAEHRGWAWRYLAAQCDQSTRSVALDTGRPEAFVPLPGAERVGVLDERGPALVDPRSGARTRPALPPWKWERVCGLGPALVAVGREDRHVGWVRLDTGRATVSASELPVTAAAGTADGARLALALRPPHGVSRIEVLDAGSGEVLAAANGDPIETPALAFSPDGQLLAASGSFLTILLLDAATGARVRVLQGHAGAATALAFSPDGRQLLSGADDKTVRLWRVADGTSTPLAGHDGEVVAVAWSADGARVASGDAVGTIRVWNATTGACERVLQGHDCAVAALAFRDARTLLSLGADGAREWDVPPGQDPDVLRCHRGRAEGNPFPYVYAVAFSPDGSLLASCGWDQTVRLVDPATGDLLATLEPGEAMTVFDVAFRADGRRILGGGKRRVLWDADTGARLASAAAGAADRSYAAAPGGGSFALTDFNVLRLVDPDTLEVQTGWADYTGVAAEDCAWSPDGRCVATVGADGRCVVRALPGTEVRLDFTAHEGEALAVAYDGSGRRLATGGADGAVRVWDAASGRRLAELRGHLGPVYAVVFHPGGRLLASGARDNTIRLWDLERGVEAIDLRGHGNYVHGLAFSPDGKTLASASGDNTVRLWTTRPMRERRARVAAERAARARVAPRVDALFAELADAAAVAAALRADASLAEEDRRAALHLVLLRAGGRR